MCISKITIFSGDKSADATRLMAIMRLGIRFGTDITIRAEGGDEAKSIEILKSFLENNL